MITAKLHTVPNNLLKHTLQYMHKLCEQSKKKKDFVSYVNLLFSRYKYNPIALYSKIHEYILINFKYLQDEYDETLISPYLMPKIKKGDCDDFALFTYCVLQILGYQPEFILFARNKGEFTHIAVVSSGIIIDGTNNRFNDFPAGFNFIRRIK